MAKLAVVLQQNQVQQYEEHYYEQRQLQGDYTFSSISPAMREQARQASEKAKKILDVSSQYFSKFNAKNARKSMSTLTSKLKNKFRQKDDPRRVFDRFSNQIRRQKKKAQESGFDGDFDDDEDDWPAFSPEEGGFDGDNMYGGRLDGSDDGSDSQGYNADITTSSDDAFYGQGSMDEGDGFCDVGMVHGNDGTPRGTTQRPTFSSYEEEDAYYATLQRNQDGEEQQWSSDFTQESNGQADGKFTVDSINEPDVDPAWGDIFPGSKQDSERKRKLNFFNVLIRGAAVQSFIIVFFRPFIVLAPSLLSSFLVIIVSKLYESSLSSTSQEMCKKGLRWTTGTGFLLLSALE